MLVIDFVEWQTFGLRKLDVFRAQYFEHFRAHEADEQRQHNGSQCDRGQYQMAQAIEGKESGLPAQ
ncbi:Uncharacterised protein [Vibrio cholerae]|nr:Uncharacterised protein [Vibrio cholerae]CSC54391.1 Uncharacterised protein [Vibrio cholerae]CSC62507.1 Uncharacterised protein [Vibrio cholerae]